MNVGNLRGLMAGLPETTEVGIADSNAGYRQIDGGGLVNSSWGGRSLVLIPGGVRTVNAKTGSFQVKRPPDPRCPICPNNHAAKVAEARTEFVKAYYEANPDAEMKEPMPVSGPQQAAWRARKAEADTEAGRGFVPPPQEPCPGHEAQATEREFSQFLAAQGWVRA